MKKLFFMSIVVIITVLASILYAAHTLISQEKQAIYLEQLYIAQYPVDMPPIVVD